MATLKRVVSCIEPLSFPFPTLDPFLFCVYHKDSYPAGDAKMQAPRKGNGADFNPSASYRMYHGDRIPGFPQHPHRGFETVTATIEGIVDHTDSMGNAGRYGQGDLQWMTAGKGVVHGEMFPLIDDKGPNDTRFFQIWLNLPKKDKMVDPAFVMHWDSEIPRYSSSDEKCVVTVWAGEYEGFKGLPPPPNSYASSDLSEVAIYHVTLLPGGTFSLPPAKGGASVNRRAYFIEGQHLDVSGTEVLHNHYATLNADLEAVLHNPSNGTAVTEVLVLQGRPIGEPVVQHGPFVMNTQSEIMAAFQDYRRTQFGGWPWPQDAMIFPRTKGRFALQNDKEEYPPGHTSTTSALIKRSVRGKKDGDEL